MFDNIEIVKSIWMQYVIYFFIYISSYYNACVYVHMTLTLELDNIVLTKT